MFSTIVTVPGTRENERKNKNKSKEKNESESRKEKILLTQIRVITVCTKKVFNL